MGPYPHAAPPAQITPHNPAGTDGMAFIEFAHPDPAALDALFTQMGFTKVARHRSKSVSLYRQGRINYVVNAQPGSFAQDFAKTHGPSACAMGWQVVDAEHAMKRAVSLGAKPVETAVGEGELTIPAIEGIGGSLIYFVDRYGDKGSIWEVDFEWIGEADPTPHGVGLDYIDHLTHNVFRGRMDHWSDWYGKIFNFREIRYFDIEGKMTGLKSRALTSPCHKIRIPINESSDDQSQIEEYLRDYNGEGIQHIASGCRDVYASVEALRANGLAFMPKPPEAYYERVDARLPGHGEPLDRLQALGLLIDGEAAELRDGRLVGETKVLLQVFSTTVVGPIFFEFIQRKGDEGFGEGNFKALFESIEEDQIRRGVLKSEGSPA